MSPIVTPKEDLEVKPTSVRLPKVMAAELERVANETGRSRSEVIVQLLRYALDAHFAESKRRKG